MEKFKRGNLRAPIFTKVLFEYESKVYSCSTRNISENGLLLTDLPFIPKINRFPVLVKIPIYPCLDEAPIGQLTTIFSRELDYLVLRVRCRLVRSNENEHATMIGCEFFEPSEYIAQSLRRYTSVSARNIIFLLGLFERTKVEVDLIKKTANYLGHDEFSNISLLRQKILHIYQSLESL